MKKNYNAARIVRDKDNQVFLKVAGKPLDRPVYFQIEEFITEPKGKIIELSKAFIIDLKTKEVSNC